MRPHVPDLLNLKHLRATEIDEQADRFVITADGQGEPTVCPQCGGTSLYRHGSQPQKYVDVPIRGKPVVVHLDRRRYRCTACGKTLFASLPDIDAKRLATVRFVRYTERLCLKRTFAELSRELGVDDKTVRHIFDDYVARLESSLPRVTPEIMGIDELKIVGQYRAMITNVSEQTLYDMLPTRNKADLNAYFRTFPDKHKVKVVTMDLWNVYRQVIEHHFPKQMIVADRWHVVRMANDAVERVRKDIRRTLSRSDRLRLKDDRFVLLARERSLTTEQRALLKDWEQRYPRLVRAYEVKEAFHALYEQRDRGTAETAAAQWLSSLTSDMALAFRETAVALKNWQQQIFNYYDCRISNAYTESINRLGKDMNRMGRGYSFEVIRARLLFEDKARVKRTTGLRSRRRPPSDEGVLYDYMSRTQLATSRPDDSQVLFYGTHIPTLCDLLEQGHFE